MSTFSFSNSEQTAYTFENDKFNFRISKDIANIKVEGYLPIATKKENLQQVLFAYGIRIIYDENGLPFFTAINSGTKDLIPLSRIYNSGKSSYNYSVNSIQLTEHSFFIQNNASSEKVFDNEDSTTPLQEEVVQFEKAPVYDLSASENITLHASGVNWAKISGTGYITGKAFGHQETTYKTGTDFSNVNYDLVYKGFFSPYGKSISSSACTLVSMLNSSEVIDRLHAYYSASKRTEIDIIRENEKPGFEYEIEKDPFGEWGNSAYLESMDYNISSFEKASCSFLEAILPDTISYQAGKDIRYYDDNGEEHHAYTPLVITKDTVFNRAYLTDEFTIILIGGGSGGSGGYDGEDGDVGQDVSTSYGRTATSKAGAGGAGGKAGIAGSGGKVLIHRLSNVSSPNNITINIGNGGIGGEKNGGLGNSGENTTFDYGNDCHLSSADGSVMGSGFYDVSSNMLLGAPGQNGYAGGAGGDGQDGENLIKGLFGNNVLSGDGGIGSDPFSLTNNDKYYVKPERDSFVSLSYHGPTSAFEATIKKKEPEYEGGNPEFGHRFEKDSSYGSFEQQVLEACEVDPVTGRWTCSAHRDYFYIEPDNAGKYAVARIYDNKIHIYYFPLATFESFGVVMIESVYESVPLDVGYTVSFSGNGGGGGAAYESNGGAASSDSGGNGANAQQPEEATIYGCGGNGGNGGGGGGGSGGISLTAQKSTPTTSFNSKKAGTGGSGSAGGNGARGCVIIY